MSSCSQQRKSPFTGCNLLKAKDEVPIKLGHHLWRPQLGGQFTRYLEGKDASLKGKQPIVMIVKETP